MTAARNLVAFAASHTSVTVTALVTLAVVVLVSWRAAVGLSGLVKSRRTAAGRRQVHADDVAQRIAAAIATVVAANGMWIFFGRVLHMSSAERAGMFAFLELAMVTCAFRARRGMRDPNIGTAGVSGLLVWIIAGLSGLFAAMAADSAAASIFRLATPLLAAFLWEQSLHIERRSQHGRRIHWRLTTERVLVRLGLAEPQQREASQVDAHRRIARLARAVRRWRRRRGSWALRQWWARRRLDAAMEQAVEHARLASDPVRQEEMRDQLGALSGAEALADLDAPAPWDRRASETQAVGEAAEIRRQAAELVEAAERARDRAVGEALRAAEAAEARAIVAARDALRARDDAERIQETVAAHVQALEESRADLRARAELAERELGEALAQARTDSARTGRARTGSPGSGSRTAPDVDRAALVAELAEEIRDAIEAGERWRPDYPDLMARTEFRRSWCEKVVRDARAAAVLPAGRTDTDAEASDGLAGVAA